MSPSFCGALPQTQLIVRPHVNVDHDSLSVDRRAWHNATRSQWNIEKLLSSRAWIESRHEKERAFQECFSKALLGINAIEGKSDM